MNGRAIHTEIILVSNYILTLQLIVDTKLVIIILFSLNLNYYNMSLLVPRFGRNYRILRRSLSNSVS